MIKIWILIIIAIFYFLTFTLCKASGLYSKLEEESLLKRI